jgi:effector-binding domain-containing protein
MFMKKKLLQGFYMAAPVLLLLALVFISAASPFQKNNILPVGLPFLQEPKYTIEEISTPARNLLYVTDSAATIAGITQKFIHIIPVELGGFMKKNGLKMAGVPIAWYYSDKPNFVFDVAAQVDKLPENTEGRIHTRVLPAGKAVVVHFYGPYELTTKAYTAAAKWMENNHKTAAGAPYEVYLGDPGIEKDPYKILTDIIFPVQ